MRHVFIVNPVSGKADASGTLVPQIIDAAKKLGADYEILLTEYPGHAVELAAEQAEAGEEVRLYACGGDGTFNEVLRGVRGRANAAVGCIPCGSGNDFVRNFAPKEQFLDIAAQLAGSPHAIDTIRTEYGYSAAICAAGLDAQVAYGIPKFKRLPFCGGSMAYTLSIAEAVFSTFRHRLRVTLDDRMLEGDYMMSAICNGRVYGGGYFAGPHALLDDGLLDVVLLKPVPRWKMAGLLARYKAGGHLTAEDAVKPEFAPYMTFCRVRTVTMEILDGRPLIVTLDGECAPRTSLHAQVCEKNLSVLLPAGLDAKTLPFVRR